MSDPLINADFSRRAVLSTSDMPWVASPQPGVWRRMLDRVGGEVARATSLVRYAPDSRFPGHEHGLGEEFLVLDGVFRDEHGAYPAGTYVRNPPGSRHAPFTIEGCVILVKLRQMAVAEIGRLVVDTAKGTFVAGAAPGHWRLPLHRSPHDGEAVAIERLDPGAVLAGGAEEGGREIFLLDGDLEDGATSHSAGAWLRDPAGPTPALRSAGGARFWVKRGHLASIARVLAA